MSVWKRAWIPLVLLGLVGCGESRDVTRAWRRDSGDCRDWVEGAPEPPALQLEAELPALEPPATSVCVSDDVVQVGRRRVAFVPAHAGDQLSAELSEAMPKPGGPRVVDVWAPANHPARHVLLVARAFSRAGVTVRLVGRRGETGRVLARVDPPRPGTIPDPGTVPGDVDVWVEMGPRRYFIGRTDGGHIPIEIDPDEPRARWDRLTEKLRDERLMAPGRQRLVFAPGEGVPYAGWAHALEIAAHAGFDQIELTPVGALEALVAEVGWELLRRQGGVHPLPEVERAPAVMPPDYATHVLPGAESPPTSIRSRVEIGPIEVGGYLDEAEVERVLRSHLTELAFCHERAPSADAQRERRAILAFVVDASGRVRSVGSVHPVHQRGAHPVLDREVMAACLRAQVARWVFSPSQTQQIAGVRLPLTFRAIARD